MSWICPNCSTSNDDAQTECFVCGAAKPAGTARSGGSGRVSDPEAPSEHEHVVFSSFDAFKTTVKSIFGGKKKPPKEPGEPKEKKKKEKKERKKKEPERTEETREEKIVTPPEEAVEVFESPWPEHKIVFHIDVLKAKGYVSMTRTTLNGVNGYKLIRADKSERFMRADTAVALKMAEKS